MSAPFWNDYPDDEAYPTASFREPIAAPDVDPDDGDLLTVCYNPAWSKILEGALMQLTEPTTWLGSAADVLLAQNRANLLQDLLQRPVPCVPVETPFWDTDSDVDDNATPDDQTWYGRVDDPTVVPTGLTFVEDVALWAFTGLLAFGVSPGLALAFHTIAPKFVVSIRTGDYLRTIRLFVDGELAATVDAHGDGSVVDVPIIAEDSDDGHQIYLTSEEYF